MLPYLLPSTQGVSKVTTVSERRSTPQKNEPITIPQKLKPNAKDKANAKYEAKVEDGKPSVKQAGSKPLNLAFIGGAPFIHLAKLKKQKVSRL